MRTIDADRLIAHLLRRPMLNTGISEVLLARGLKAFIDDQPTIEAEPVRHGEWELIADCANEGVYCSNCHKKVYKADYANQKLKSKRCPNCGAKMDGGA